MFEIKRTTRAQAGAQDYVENFDQQFLTPEGARDFMYAFEKANLAASAYGGACEDIIDLVTEYPFEYWYRSADQTIEWEILQVV